MKTPEMRADARLNGVCFVSPSVGWAVGDRGSVWHTTDGGRHWTLQRSGVTCPLYSVCFISDRVGWIGGGSTQPYRHGSSGVLLMTSDGGKTWNKNSRAALPALHKIRFVSEKFGFAIGDASPLFPAAAFVTDSGGMSWQPVHGDHPAGWTTGDMTGPNTGALAGRLGATAAVRRRTVDAERAPNLGLRTLRGMQLVPNGYGWLIGDGGLVMLTGDWGITWQSAPGRMPEGIRDNFDFAAIAVRGAKCWVAGSPGTRVLRTDDAGKTWTAFPTGQNAPIHAITFIDDQHGWAVGALGAILATDDGGQTWRRQRTGGTRAAMLGVFSRPEDAPLEMLAETSGNEGYLSVVEIVNRRDVETPADRAAALENRMREAVVSLGGSDASLAWRFPLGLEGLDLNDQAILDHWNRANDGKGLEMLQAHLVRQIRLWRPDVVVTHAASPTGDDPRRHLINQAVLSATERAADPTAFVDQITGAGLEPWEVKKVYSVGPELADAKLTVAESKIAERLGRSLGEIAADARGLLDKEFRPGPEMIGFRLMLDRIDNHGLQDGFFDRIMLPPGGEARRSLLNPTTSSLSAIHDLAQRRRNARAILRRAEKDTLGGRNLLAKAGSLTRGMESADACRILYHLARQYQQRGEWPLAAETLEMLVDRHPQAPLAAEAMAWLVQYYASTEAAWRVQNSQRQTKATLTGNPKSKPSIDATLLEDRPAKAAEFAKRLHRIRPELSDDPQIGFPLAVADRMRGLPGQAERFFLTQRRRDLHDAWWSCAQGEHWLAEPKGVAPKPMLRCVIAAAKPKLDGKLDEPMWRRAKAVLLRSQPGSIQREPASLKMAYDQDFLYLACQGKCEEGTEYRESTGARTYDTDLSSRDRISIFLDLDRDFVTYYRLTVDHRGWPGDACWGDRSWNPTWSIAHETKDGKWTVEAAIPLDQLTGRYPRSGDVWALGAQRVIPGLDFQSWNTPAAPNVLPEGFGYLTFQ
jgi:photosystem II stability/assembly factor-like uncharacterized protein